ncbi:poly(R)-hydroxyalkanoic acid synthase subunit PhaE [Bradyrhizobium sp. HKCCYLS20291]|uniref:poly(R)-hydroxyalkanoic acid synthase subunit PhaE n=1 Tax=Bradyrhizobium sp. HKCCYLS20291 TaxID=3420766 RepID=UPI003EBDD57B
MADKGNDPWAMWQTMLGEMEKSFNTFAGQAVSSPEFSKAMNQAGGASAGAQKQMSEVMEKYLGGLNMPSRAQMVDMAVRLQSIEAQLAEIKSLLLQSGAAAGAQRAGQPGSPRPPRTKQPPGEQK